MCKSCDKPPSCPFTVADQTQCCGRSCKSCTVDGVSLASGATWSRYECEETCTCHGGVVSCVKSTDPAQYCSHNAMVWKCTPEKHRLHPID